MAELIPKVQISALPLQMSGASEDMSAATYKIHDESHTIGNVLRWMIMKKYVSYLNDGPPDVRIVSPKVEFCGYSVPHPSENFIHVRIQMYDHLSSLTALLTALDDLDALCSTIDTAYRSSIQTDTYERWEEKS
ncbi:RBP11-like subunits of RNA polymerase [Armillaria novae-zelandiae]|uniref:RBP11-like subunits of RNA polymerase n=1 Tax=Armillaria novae-zelandiae TaxID=153914 RepID=A0AA39PB48_9AGAR|nr:RBP11-like subunits of RNA polymerase [Armillaria novae-zelandiae]